MLINDVHSQLNATTVKEVRRPTSVAELQRSVMECAAAGNPFAICGTRHAMGAQQMLSDGVLIDVTALTQVTAFDHDRGLLTVEAGIQWPALIDTYLRMQREADGSREPRWGIAQKQTGGDEMTIGGALAANAHGRGLTMAPMVADVESFTLVSPSGDLVMCSRQTNADSSDSPSAATDCSAPSPRSPSDSCRGG